jgi:predicted 3-demethylubiquinone-9 3-methyltransferase (glyoxalase superfamily)
MPRITPFLWFDDQAEQAARFYTTVFPSSRIVSASPMVVELELDGTRLTAFNGGPQFQFTEAVSFVVDCDSQGEVDDYWAKLTADGGRESRCGWLKDKYGLSWQIVPKVLPKLLSDPDRARADRVMQAMLKMTRIDIAALERAAAG